MEGDEKAGFSIFWADDGLDTGPILLQKETKVDINDTVDTIYTRFLYPEGIRAMVSCFIQMYCGGNLYKLVQNVLYSYICMFLRKRNKNGLLTIPDNS